MFFCDKILLTKEKRMKLFLTCLMIFFFRVVSVIFATVRTVYTVKGQKTLACISGFIETMIYFYAISDALSQSGSDKIWVALAYSGGYAVGTLIGCVVSKLLIATNVSVQVITTEGNKELLHKIRDAGYGHTSLTVYGKSSNDRRYLIFVTTDSKKLKKLKDIILTNDPSAFVTVNENTEVYNGYFQNIK